ncbi:type IV conjugative transfer system protein TraL [Loktanella sp. IMCC34160]|uniref:type IV conjugative transfer system protein TraL n=1 Tax=Loktanella sp. IMCC34160 TaxID=2510646 RepID=UPI00101B5FAA|nr:type IV conjugative transfer system protein TraL [Loktanella sp. IMCC34160]RYG89922.1 type IV conjugative transfer system protein TraL [Loktanella sp. IMCC34160]
MDTRIEQRLQDPPRVLMLPADEAILLGLPVLMGLLGKQVITGVIVAVTLWMIWKRIKGDTGLEGVAAAAYWFLPTGFGLLKELPDASVDLWEA